MEDFEKRLLGEKFANHIHKLSIEIEYDEYLKLSELVKSEIKVFEDWKSSLKTKELQLREQQEKIEKKANKTLYEEALLEMDINDCLSEKDENNIQFEEEILKVLVILIYSKIEILLKLIYEDKNNKKLSGKYKDWENKYKADNSIDFKTLSGYREIQYIRLLNNNYKHSGVILSESSAKEIFKYKFFDILKDYSGGKTIDELKAMDKEIFLKFIKEKRIKVILNKEKILYLHQQAGYFLKEIINRLFP